MSFDWAQRAADIIAGGKTCVLVTVLAVRGSAPRDVGTKMIVSDGRVFGTIGGGNFEFLIIGQCRKMLASQDTNPRVQHYPLGPMTQQCCGGAVSVSLEYLEQCHAPFLERLTSKQATGTLISKFDGAVTDKIIEGTGVSTQTTYQDSGPVTSENASLRGLTLTRFDEPLIEVKIPLYIFGAGHVGQALVNILAPLNFDMIWIDNRPEVLNDIDSGRFTPVISDKPIDRISTAPAGAMYLVFTHSHALDFEITSAILSRNDAGFVGLIGSQTKRARFLKRFVSEKGLSEVQLSRLTCPIGVEGISNKAPAAIAVAVAAQLLTVSETLKT